MDTNTVVAAVIMEKGGVGKTTVSLNLAVAALQNGRNAAVIDIDPQATASNWTDRRTDEKPWVVPTLAARLTAAIEKAKSQGVDFIVIDTPPHSGTDSVEAARRADVVLVPVEGCFCPTARKGKSFIDRPIQLSSRSPRKALFQ